VFPRLHFEIANGESRLFDERTAEFSISEDEREGDAAALIRRDKMEGRKAQVLMRFAGGGGEILVPN
jgi:hypothetical protein